jgi:hypothetical protein
MAIERRLLFYGAIQAKPRGGAQGRIAAFRVIG